MSFAAAGRPAEALLMRHLLQLQFWMLQETEQYDVPATAYGDFVSLPIKSMLVKAVILSDFFR